MNQHASQSNPLIFMILVKKNTHMNLRNKQGTQVTSHPFTRMTDSCHRDVCQDDKRGCSGSLVVWSQCFTKLIQSKLILRGHDRLLLPVTASFLSSPLLLRDLPNATATKTYKEMRINQMQLGINSVN